MPLPSIPLLVHAYVDKGVSPRDMVDARISGSVFILADQSSAAEAPGISFSFGGIPGFNFSISS